MSLEVNPQQIVVAGENSFIRLSGDGGDTPAHWASQRRVFWSEAGAGHALFLDSELAGGLRVFADNDDLARLLQERIESLPYGPFADMQLEVTPAVFNRRTPPGRSGTTNSSTVNREAFWRRDF